jgi:large subunit ribosomal protein L24
MKVRIKKDDTVTVISGAHKRKSGKVMSVLRAKDQVVVEGINVRKKALKRSQEHPQGGFLERECPIHISNIMLQERYDERHGDVDEDYDEVEETAAAEEAVARTNADDEDVQDDTEEDLETAEAVVTETDAGDADVQDDTEEDADHEAEVATDDLTEPRDPETETAAADRPIAEAADEAELNVALTGPPAHIAADETPTAAAAEPPAGGDAADETTEPYDESRRSRKRKE